MLYYPTQVQYVNPEKLKYTPKEILVNSEDGQKLSAWHFQQKNSMSSPKPTILFFHGNAQNLSSHFMSLYWVLEEGYDFLIFDYPGYGKSEGEPTPKTTVDSGLVFWNYLKEKNPKKPIAIFGQSLGGAVAMKVAIHLKKDPLLCLVAVDSTFSSYQAVGRKVLSRSWITWPFQWLSYLVLSDSQAPDGEIRDISPIPLIVTHGRKDRVVEFELGEDVYQQAEQPKYFWPVPSGAHIESFSNREIGVKLRKDFVYHLVKSCSAEKELSL